MIWIKGDQQRRPATAVVTSASRDPWRDGDIAEATAAPARRRDAEAAASTDVPESEPDGYLLRRPGSR
ncbi:hypothetical protein [Streptomyces sp. NPDC006446]|uniref:hypothetical protein n=1 Tax=Streptomyces sp. NPDC006446 TaxID=3154301 RepID=UPI0033A17DA3